MEQDKNLSTLVKENAREIFSDHTLLGFSNNSETNQYMPGRHIAVNQTHARQIFEANKNCPILSIVYFKDEKVDFNKINQFIGVINNFAINTKDEHFIKRVKSFYSKRKCDIPISDKFRPAHRKGLLDIKKHNSKNTVTEYKVTSTPEFLFNKNATISVYKRRNSTDREAKSETLRNRKKQLSFIVSNRSKEEKPLFVITHFVKELRPS